MQIKKFIDDNIIKIAAAAVSIYFLIITLVLISGFLGQFSWLFSALVMSIIIALIVKPINDSFANAGLSKRISILFGYIILFAIIAIIIFLLLPPLVDELKTFLGPGIKEIKDKFPSMEPVNNFLQQFNSSANISADQVTKPLTDNIGNIISNLGSVATNIVGLIVEFILGIVFSIFLISDGKNLSRFLFKITPKYFKDDYLVVSKALVDGFRSFIKIQGFSALSYSIIVMITMKLLGYDYILIAGFLSFIAFLIPGIGGPIALIPPLALGLLFKNDNLLNVVALMVILLVVQNIILNFLMPKFYGERFGIHPALVLIVILVSLQLFGILGVILAIPIASAIQQLIANYLGPEKNAKTD